MNIPSENWANEAYVITAEEKTPLAIIAEEATRYLLDYLKEAQGKVSITAIESLFMGAMMKYKETP